MKCWSVGKMEAWKEKTPFAYLDEGSQQHKLFCFAMVLIIHTIITDMNILGNAWFLLSYKCSLVATKYGTPWCPSTYLNEICWKQMSTLALSTPLELNIHVYMR